MDDIAVSFGTDGWRARGEEFTTRRVEAIGRAVAAYLDDQSAAGDIAVGHDARRNSREAAMALADVLAASGRDVAVPARDCPTPALAWTVAQGPFAGGLMVTASHNPPEYNGVKFVTDDGAPALPAVTDALEERLAPPPARFPTDRAVDGAEQRDTESQGTIHERALAGPYVDELLGLVDADLSGLTVAYDAMHGSGRGVTDTALERAGATVTRLRCSRDPTFGGVAPEPGPETADGLRSRVGREDGSADIGLLNDGDADRVGIVTPGRGYLDANVVFAVLYEFLLQRYGAGPVVRSVPTSSLVDRVAAAAGQQVHETPVGFKWIAAAMVEHGALAGGEESGGYGLTRHLPNKDGVLVALLACAAHQEQPLDARIDALRATHGPVHQDRVSVDCPGDRKEDTVTTLQRDPPATLAESPVEDISTVDGVKLVLTDGEWLLVRPSGTEPKLRLYAEAGSRERVDALLAAGRELLERKA